MASASAEESSSTVKPDRQNVLDRARELYVAGLKEVVVRAEELGTPAEEFLAGLGDDLFEPVADAFHDTILANEASWATSANAYQREFVDRLLARYGTAVNGLLVFIDLCVESASNVYGRGEGQVDATGEVVLDLHARACLVAKEIATLLASGYPWGALAAWRTLHELSVIATVLSEHGRANESDLTSRWLAHDAVIHLQDAQIFQERAVRLGYDPLSDEALDILRSRAADAVDRYGSGITMRNGYGWAVEVCKPAGPGFKRLEELAGRGHLRGHYRWASHRVHGDSRGNEHNLITFRGRTLRLAGPTNLGLVDAADLTTGSLWVATNCALTGVRDDGQPEPEEVVMMLTLGKLRDRVVQGFADGEQSVEDAEAKLLAEDMGDTVGGSPAS